MQIGSKVVCVDDSPCKCGDCGGSPVEVIKDRVYSVCALVLKDGELLIGLIGVSYSEDKFHPASNLYGAQRFRLLDELKQQARETNAQKRLHL